MSITTTDTTANQGYQTKLQQMLDTIPDSLDKREGSIIYDALAPIALQLWIEESKFQGILEQAFAVTAEGRYLELIAKDHGLQRTPATHAKVTLVFTGVIGKTVPKGTTCGVPDSDVSFVTDEAVVIDNQGRATVLATCKLSGAIGNVGANKITLIFDPILDIWTVTNPEPAKGGADEESDQSLRNRILYQKRNPEHGGTDSDYVRWALSVTGVTYAKAIDKPRGIGTVDVIVGGNETQIDQIVQDTQGEINRKKPSGVDVKVRKVRMQEVPIRVKVEGIDADKAIKAIREYTSTIGVGGTVYWAKILSAVINAGATDATMIQPTQNIKLEDDSAIDVVVNIE
ncbi:baseplate J/gp47 family protein [Brevibacillus dissolubilis]|uniref:baseplate J/gp47 family protein n=1 Tax=Brevibacillus dissolubilis TaxID=1844116 RepID=UPI0011166806|nr:baseplate J/gp47 family protein [Brevibacillus dissolubilis]